MAKRLGTKEEIEREKLSVDLEMARLALAAKQAEAEDAEHTREVAREKAHAELVTAQCNAQKLIDDMRRSETANAHRRVYDFTDYVKKSSVEDCIAALSAMARESSDPITLRFTSGGGSALQGYALFDFLLGIRAAGIHLTTVSLGYACSMAGILLQAGTTRLIGHASWLHIHEASGYNWGTTSQMKEDVAWQERLEDYFIAVMADRSSLTAEQIKTRIRGRDWWLSGTEAVDLGLADALFTAESYALTAPTDDEDDRVAE